MHSTASGGNAFINMTLINVIVLSIISPNPERSFLCIKSTVKDNLNAFIFSSLLWDQVELTLTNDPHWSHYPRESEISQRRSPKNRKLSEGLVEGRENLRERVQERSSCCGGCGQRNMNRGQGQDR